jgi:hypothetical protein
MLESLTMKRPIVGRLIDEAPRFEMAWRRQVARQIYFPLAAGVVILGAVAVALALGGGGGDASLWADLALIYLAAAAGIVGLFALVVVAGLAYGVGWLVGRIPEPARRAREVAGRLRLGARRAADAIASAAIEVRALAAGAKSVRGALRNAIGRR